MENGGWANNGFMPTKSFTSVKVILPRHSSAIGLLFPKQRIRDDDDDNEVEMRVVEEQGPQDVQEELAAFLQCYSAGVLWRALAPMLFSEKKVDDRNRCCMDEEALKSVSQHILFLMFRHALLTSTGRNSKGARMTMDGAITVKEYNRRRLVHGKESRQQNANGRMEDVESVNSSETVNSSEFFIRQIPLPSRLVRRFFRHLFPSRACPRHISILPLYIFPPLSIRLDGTFEAVVVSHERIVLKKQTMTAFMATLGGGFYMMKNLQPALQLARTQRALAMELGNHRMAQQCLLNEAYNLLYAGKFRFAKTVLAQLEYEMHQVQTSSLTSWADREDAQQTLRQCRAARILMRRLQRLSHRLSKHRSGVNSNHIPDEQAANRTTDDFYRLRIVAS